MSRLPTVGADTDEWGNILNDFLLEEHNSDGTQKTVSVAKGGTGGNDSISARTNLSAAATSDLANYLPTASKNQTGGYAGLDSGVKLSLSQIPTVPVNKGGTGTATAPSSGQVLTYSQSSGTLVGTSTTALADKTEFAKHETIAQNIRTTNVLPTAISTVDSTQAITSTLPLEVNYSTGVLPSSTSDYKKIFANTTYKNATFSLRFDDNPSSDYYSIYKLLLKYNLVAAFAICRGGQHALDADNLGNTSKMTLAQAIEMQGHGMEMIAHSRYHWGIGTSGAVSTDPGYIGGLDSTFTSQWSTFVDEFVVSSLELRSFGLWCDNFAPPGVWSSNSPYAFAGYDNNGVNVASYSNQSVCDVGPPALLARQYFAAVEGYFAGAGFFGASDSLPALRRYGISHTTGDNLNNYAGTTTQPTTNPDGSPVLTTDQNTKITSLKGYVNDAIHYGGRGAFNFHSAGMYGAYVDSSNTRQPTRAWSTYSTAEKQAWTAGLNITALDSFLSYLKTQRDAGLIDIMTPTAVAYAHYSPTKINLCTDPGFLQAYAGNASCWSAPGSAPTLSNTGGNTAGNGYVEIPNSSSTYVMKLSAQSNRSICLEAYVQTSTGVSSKPKIIIKAVNGATVYSTVTYPTDYESNADTSLNIDSTVSGSSWTKVRVSAGSHPAAKEIQIILSNVDTGSIPMRFSDILVYQQ